MNHASISTIRLLCAGFALLGFALAAPNSSAGNATWQSDPLSGLWNLPENWQPNTVPDSAAETATFAQSRKTSISFSNGITVGAILFNPGASDYTFTVGPEFELAVSGDGITNNSGTLQTFVAATDAAGNFGVISFHGSAIAGDLCSLRTHGGEVTGAAGGLVQFTDEASAGHSTSTLNGAAISNAARPISSITRADQIGASGVTIGSGATFDFVAIGNKELPLGQVFTVIGDVSPDPFAGTFNNLPDGAIVAIGRNTFQANYEGGDGNDLTLTVVP